MIVILQTAVTGFIWTIFAFIISRCLIRIFFEEKRRHLNELMKLGLEDATLGPLSKHLN